MRAAIIHEHGKADVLRIEQVKRPAIRPTDIVVRVESCGLNYLDIFSREGMPGLPIDLPHISGGDIAGIVSEVGQEVSTVVPGERVMLNPSIDRDGKHYLLGETTWGGLAEFVVAPATAAIPLPDSVSFDQAAALPIAYGTAWRMVFDRGNITSGETVVILGASGGVGVACVQFAAMAGAKVVAAASAEWKLDRLRALGAEETLNYVDNPEWHRNIREMTNGNGADVVIDYTGASTWQRTLKSLRKGGRVLTCGATSGYDAVTDLRYVWTRELSILGSNGWTESALKSVLDSVANGSVEAVIHETIPLDRIRDGHDLLEDRQVLGKVIVHSNR